MFSQRDSCGQACVSRHGQPSDKRHLGVFEIVGAVSPYPMSPCVSSWPLSSSHRRSFLHFSTIAPASGTLICPFHGVTTSSHPSIVSIASSLPRLESHGPGRSGDTTTDVAHTTASMHGTSLNIRVLVLAIAAAARRHRHLDCSSFCWCA